MFTHSLHDALRTTAAMQPRGLAFINNVHSIRYGDLMNDVDRASRFILSQGLEAGNRVALVLPFTYLHVVLILALDRLGIASVSRAPNFQFREMAELQTLKINAVFAAESKPDGLDVPWAELDPQSLPADLDLPAGAADAPIPTDSDPDRVVRLVETSGTTGQPNVVALTRQTALKRIMAHQLYCEGQGSNRFLLGMPVHTIAGYGWLLMALMRGATAIPGIGPRHLGRFIELFQVSHLLLSPGAFRFLVIDGNRNPRDFSSVCSTTTGGAPFDATLAQLARIVLGPNIWNAYTSTEAGSVARGHVTQLLGNPAMIGSVLPFVTVEIVDDAGKLLPAGETGQVRIASDLAVSHYEGGPDVDQSAFRDGYFYPGDLGSLDADGRLSIEGRLDGRVNLLGNKVPAETIERELRTVQGVIDAAVFEADTGLGRKAHAAIVAAEGQTAETLTPVIAKALGRMAPEVILTVDALPRTDMGKTERWKLAEMVGGGMG